LVSDLTGGDLVRAEQAHIRRFYSTMLLRRDAPGDRDRARRLLGEAV
jgi:hypothetical protein